jgi:hypothetical protein
MVPQRIRPMYSMDLWLAKPISRNPKLNGKAMAMSVFLRPNIARQGPAIKLPKMEHRGGTLPVVKVFINIVQVTMDPHRFPYQSGDCDQI